MIDDDDDDDDDDGNNDIQVITSGTTTLRLTNRLVRLTELTFVYKGLYQKSFIFQSIYF